eukprot:CAMPEP_0198237606 /NCGR_PEP_ID=MMETSP1446-20131203/3386_1 /TAXON_ID=1461542 ORGANISM="Unidentified sp, Strain CCMP2111" /NCGR_SAMPLE_ID=MMETSP1446 /ASSEMBLY_ACC=CAM_ASM_001112 /LENGTH=602 /DNA_ID=CAMNT_0043919787 /DNA_START=149 /DNA_END=1957 /DNA_ORIENTATION=+
MADADEATNALIAKMLAEDDAYEDAYGFGMDDSDEDDWGSGKRKKRKKKASSRGASSRPKKEKKEKPAPEPGELTASGRRRRKDTGKKRTVSSRPWTEEEERLFREALKLFGRNWKSCSSHVGTRDAKAFTSHAQKHFIRLCLQGKPLPRKVAESGEGYTLSGKPLDPNSAAARAYGFKPDTLDKMREQMGAALMEVEGGLACQRVAIDEGEPYEADEVVKLGNNGSLGKENENENGNGNLVATQPEAEKVEAQKAETQKVETQEVEAQKQRVEKKKPKQRARKAPSENIPKIAVEPTEYALNRPKRENAGRKTGSSDFVSSMSGSLQLVPCKGFPVCQPFSVQIEDDAMVVMDFHAHLSRFEVIGYLGGEWDSVKKHLYIKSAFPCRGLAGTQQTDSCEMDPASELAAKDKMDTLGLKVVGWYHSHPTFKPNPSLKDIENQENYQAFFKQEQEGQEQQGKCKASEPFVGMIFSPYDLRLPSKASRREVFWVQKHHSEPTPMHMKHSSSGITSSGGLPSEQARETMSGLIGSVEEGRVNLTELWRPFTNIVDGKIPEGGPCTKLAKLRGALSEYLPETDEAEDFLDQVFTEIQSKWSVDLGY